MARSFLFALLLSSVHCLAPFFPVRVSFSPAPPVSLHPVPYSFLRPPLLFLSFRRPGPTCSRLFLCHLARPFLTLGLSPYSSSLLLPFSLPACIQFLILIALSRRAKYSFRPEIPVWNALCRFSSCPPRGPAWSLGRACFPLYSGFFAFYFEGRKISLSLGIPYTCG